jgi:hypothetical protein
MFVVQSRLLAVTFSVAARAVVRAYRQQAAVLRWQGLRGTYTSAATTRKLLDAVGQVCRQLPHLPCALR